MVDLGTLGGTFSEAIAVNARGQVVGGSNTIGDTASHAFSWTAGGGMVDLGALPGGNQSGARAVNARGQVVGESFTSTGTIDAVLWQPA
jgi:probable HAF family extracellular repeat protein